ncbi:MAG: hypothetical protein IKF50_03005 [Clostridia bacterium]|nr:hypothetical protein [Clostridia bacterium]
MRKKTLVLLSVLLVVLLLMMTACGKSSEAKKADELILAIGEVDLESKDAVQAARIYYDMLTDKQKNQVENYSILEQAEADLGQLEEYEEIYARAQDYDKQNEIDKAYEYYSQLPESFKDTKAKKDALAPYVGICGTWICDVQLAKAQNGAEWRPLYSTVKISIDSRSGNSVTFKYEGTTTTIDSKHILFNKFDMWGAKGHDEGMFWNCTVLADGSRAFDEQLTMGGTNLGQMYEQFTFSSDGKMTESIRIDKHNLYVSFPYTKTN